MTVLIGCIWRRKSRCWKGRKLRNTHTLATILLARHRLGTALVQYQRCLFEIAFELPLKAPHSVVMLEMVSLESMDRLSKVSSDPVNSIAWLRTSSLLDVEIRGQRSSFKIKSVVMRHPTDMYSQTLRRDWILG